jgi:uncharacterized protein YbjQ (UPF0145 family)
MDAKSVTTAFELPGFRVADNVGVVRGIVVRSRSVIGNFFAGLQTLLGGDISIYANMCERARADAYRRMVAQAEEHGANAIIGVNYGATEIATGVTEVICYGTAVIVAPISGALRAGRIAGQDGRPAAERSAFGRQPQGPWGSA